jgi:hypothetical protein
VKVQQPAMGRKGAVWEGLRNGGLRGRHWEVVMGGRRWCSSQGAEGGGGGGEWKQAGGSRRDQRRRRREAGGCGVGRRKWLRRMMGWMVNPRSSR